MEEIKVNLKNLTEEERKFLMDLVKKGNEEKLDIEYPNDGTKYYFIASISGIFTTNFNRNNSDDIYRYEHNNFFLTYKEAKFEQEKQKVLFELKYWSGGYKYIFNGRNYYLFYDLEKDKIYTDFNHHSKNLNNIYFQSYKDALNAIKQVGEYRIKEYLFEIGD